MKKKKIRKIANSMKKLLFTIVMAVLCTVNGYSQEIYNEVKA